MTVRVHPFPSRTRQLSSLVPTILGWKRPGKIGRCQHKQKDTALRRVFFVCSGFCLFYRFLQTANLITELNRGNMHRRCIFEPWPYTLRFVLTTSHGGGPVTVGGLGFDHCLYNLCFRPLPVQKLRSCAAKRRNSRPRQRDYDKYALMPRRLAGSGLVR